MVFKKITFPKKFRIVIVAIILLPIILGLLIGPSYGGVTDIAGFCNPDAPADTHVGWSYSYDPAIFTGVVNLVEVCESREYLLCTQKTPQNLFPREFRIDKGSCQWEWQILGLSKFQGLWKALD